MIIDKLENLEKYAALHPLFPKAIDFLLSADLENLHPGRIQLEGNELVVNVDETQPKLQTEAQLEAHKKYIDIQLPLTGKEVIGYTPVKECLPMDAFYNEESDITFFEGMATNYLEVSPGMFAIFFPQDGHAPAITSGGIKKIVVKVKL